MRRLTLLLVLLLVGCLEPMEPPGPQVSIEPAEPTTDDDLTLVQIEATDQ